MLRIRGTSRDGRILTPLAVGGPRVPTASRQPSVAMAITPVPASRAAGGEIEVQAREAGQAAAEAVAGVVATLAAAAALVVVASGAVAVFGDSLSPWAP